MAQAHSTGSFRRRLLGYDRRAVDAALTAAADRLQRAETRRDELIETTANVERIGAQVADMLRSLADRAVELEDEAAAQAAAVVQAAELEADQIRVQAAAVLAEAEATAQQIVESSCRQQATIAERRETALISLRIAMDQMGRLATTIDEIDLTAEPTAAPTRADAETVVLLPGNPPEVAAEDPAPSPPVTASSDPLAAIRARVDGWTKTS